MDCLANHEQEVEELVHNYRNAGNYVLDLFVRDREAAFELNEAQLHQIRGQLSAALESSLEVAMRTLNGVSDERHEFMAQFNAHQGEGMDTAEDEAMDAADEEAMDIAEED